MEEKAVNFLAVRVGCGESRCASVLRFESVCRWASGLPLWFRFVGLPELHLSAALCFVAMK